MPERQSVGRRFVDLRPDAPLPLYPVELERRRHARREGDRPPLENRRGHRRASLLFCAHWTCAWCGFELRHQRNIPGNARRFVLVEHPQILPCDCLEARLAGKAIILSWKFQGGAEL